MLYGSVIIRGLGVSNICNVFQRFASDFHGEVLYSGVQAGGW